MHPGESVSLWRVSWQVLESKNINKNGSRRTTVSEQYNRYASEESTVFTVSGSGVMAIGYVTSVFLNRVCSAVERTPIMKLKYVVKIYLAKK